MKSLIKSLGFIILLNFFGYSSLLAEEVPSYQLLPVENAKELKTGYGYLLFNLKVSGVTPSIVVSKIKSRNGLYLKPSDKFKYQGKQKKITLNQASPGFYLVKLPKGLYQITEVNTPYFDLPFKLNTAKRLEWRVSVAEKKINYAGLLEINKERSAKVVDVNLINRIATDKQEIEAQLKELLIKMPLKNGAGIRDDFWSELEEE